MPPDLRSRISILVLLVALLLILQPSPVPFNVKDRIQSIKAAAEFDRMEDARQILDILIEENPQLNGLHRAAARLALQDGDIRKAREHVDQSVHPIEDACLETSLYLMETTQPDLKRLNPLDLENCPIVVEPLQKLVAGHLHSSDPTAALPALEFLNEIHALGERDQAQYLYLLALVDPPYAKEVLRRFEDSNQIDRAVLQALEDNLAQSSEHVSSESLFSLGRIYAQFGEWYLARLAFETALEQTPLDPVLQAYYGFALDHTDSDGIREMEQAVNAAPNSATIHTLIGMHWLKQGANEQAIQSFTWAIELEPENPWIRVQLASAYLEAGDVPQASENYRVATAISPETAEIWMQMAEYSTLNEVNLSSMGIPAARNAFITGKGDPDAASLLGYAYLQTGEIRIGERLIHRAVSQDPDSAMIQYHLGILKSIQGDSTSGRAAFQRAQALDPDGTYGHLAEILLRQ